MRTNPFLNIIWELRSPMKQDTYNHTILICFRLFPIQRQFQSIPHVTRQLMSILNISTLESLEG